MKKYALLNDQNELLGYSDFPVQDYTHIVSNRDGTINTIHIKCVAGVSYNSENIGKIYDIQTETFI